MTAIEAHTQNLSVQQAQEQYTALVEFTRSVLKDGLDFGTIPGVKKPSLLKPGAEKLANLYRLRPAFEIVTSREDWDGGFFYYHYRCTLTRDGEFMGQAEGSCNTKEKKYRYRNAERVCPHCGQAAIIKGKAEYGGGWVCFDKKGGCKAKFKDGDPAIEGQEVGQVENPEIFDAVNTVQKMAQKRAFVAVVLTATGASEFFTQDVEDLATFAPVVTQEAKPPASSQEGREGASQPQTPPVPEKATPGPASGQAEATAGTPETGKDPLEAWASRIGTIRLRLEQLKVPGGEIATALSGHDWRATTKGARLVYQALLDLGTEYAPGGPKYKGPTASEMADAMITAPQVKALQGHARRAGADTSEKRGALWAHFLGEFKPVTTKNLTEAEAQVLIDTLSGQSNEELAAELAKALDVPPSVDNPDDLPF